MTIDNPFMTVDERIDQFVAALNAKAAFYAATNDYSTADVFRRDEQKKGQKFLRIVRQGSNQSFVDCFVELETGKIIKPGGWKAPAKDKDGLAYRWDLMDHVSRHDLFDTGIYYHGGTDTYKR